jgi:hypothetical protein
MLKKKNKSVTLLIQAALDTQQRLELLEAKVKQLENYHRLTIKILFMLLMILSQVAK